MGSLHAWVPQQRHASRHSHTRVSKQALTHARVSVQGNEANQKLLGAANGIDTLLVCLAGYKSREPADAEEQETVENLFDCLCSCLLLPANRCEG